MTTIEEYEQQALEDWLKHFEDCAAELEIDIDYQTRQYAVEAWHECKQVRFIEYDSVLKVKWEHRCWWGDCPSPRNFLGSYSCILIDIPVEGWEEPYVRAKRLEREQE